MNVNNLNDNEEKKIADWEYRIKIHTGEQYRNWRMFGFMLSDYDLDFELSENLNNLKKFYDDIVNKKTTGRLVKSVLFRKTRFMAVDEDNLHLFKNIIDEAEALSKKWIQHKNAENSDEYIAKWNKDMKNWGIGDNAYLSDDEKWHREVEFNGKNFGCPCSDSFIEELCRPSMLKALEIAYKEVENGVGVERIVYDIFENKEFCVSKSNLNQLKDYIEKTSKLAREWYAHKKEIN